MRITGLRPVVLAAVIAAAVLSFLVVAGSRSTTEAHLADTFDPQSIFLVCNDLENFAKLPSLNDPDADTANDCFADGSQVKTANTSRDQTTVLNIPVDDSNFSLVVFTASPATVYKPAADLPVGEVVGANQSEVHLGIINGACNQLLPPEFVLKNGSTDPSTVVKLRPEGLPERDITLIMKDSLDDDGDGLYAEDGTLADAQLFNQNGDKDAYTDVDDDGDTLANEDSSNELATHEVGVTRYPEFLNLLFDPDLDWMGGPNGPKPPLTPYARYVGFEWISSTPIVLQFITFAPGQLSEFAAPHPFSAFGAEKGWTTITILEQTGAEIQAQPSQITDFCTALKSFVMLKGTTAGGYARGANPPAGTGINLEGSGATGTHLYGSYVASWRQADGDAYENNIDTCPLNTNTDTDPFVNKGADLDGIDASCDDAPSTNDGSDKDNDGFDNNQDNCPEVDNATQLDSESTTIYSSAAPDGGPRGDSIGDLCEANDTVSNGHFHVVFNIIAKCIGGTDGDDDGYCDTIDPNDASAANGNTGVGLPELLALEFGFGSVDAGATPISPATKGVGTVCTDGIDNDGDGNTDGADAGCVPSGSDTDSDGLNPDNCPSKWNPDQVNTDADSTGDACDTDIDGDNWLNATEHRLGTDPIDKCPNNVAGAQKHDAWPPDMDVSKAVNISDLVPFKPHFGSVVGGPTYHPRFDLDLSGGINISDLVPFKPYFGNTCS